MTSTMTILSCRRQCCRQDRIDHLRFSTNLWLGPASAAIVDLFGCFPPPSPPPTPSEGGGVGGGEGGGEETNQLKFILQRKMSPRWSPRARPVAPRRPTMQAHVGIDRLPSQESLRGLAFPDCAPTWCPPRQLLIGVVVSDRNIECFLRCWGFGAFPGQPPVSGEAHDAKHVGIDRSSTQSWQVGGVVAISARRSLE